MKSEFNSESATAFSKLRSESKPFSDVKRFLLDNSIDSSIVIGSAINYMKSELKAETLSPLYKSKLISSIENLYHLSLLSSVGDVKNIATKNFRKFFTSNGSSIEYCYIKGEVPPIDFSSLTISNSRFSNYQQFLNGNFENSKFMYTEFSNCNNKSIKNESFICSDVDINTCILGDLDDAINSIYESFEKQKDIIESECKKFFSSFRRGVYFKDNNISHITFSSKVKGLYKKNFDRLIKEGYIELSNEKQVDNFYRVEKKFEDSVKDFMTNAQIDSNMKKFINYVNT